MYLLFHGYELWDINMVWYFFREIGTLDHNVTLEYMHISNAHILNTIVEKIDNNVIDFDKAIKLIVRSARNNIFDAIDNKES